MQRILEGLPCVECQMDETVVYGGNQAEYDERLEAVLLRLQKEKVTSNCQKCEFSKASVRFLGQLVGKDGIRPDPSKVSAVKHRAKPTDIHELWRFLGILNQSSKYIPNLAELTHPLRQLLSKTNALVWGPKLLIQSKTLHWALHQHSQSMIFPLRPSSQLMRRRIDWVRSWPKNKVMVRTLLRRTRYLEHRLPSRMMSKITVLRKRLVFTFNMYLPPYRPQTHSLSE